MRLGTDEIIIGEKDGTRIVSITTDGSTERLAVDANVEGGLSLQRFSPNSDFNVTGNVTNTSTDTTLVSVTADGALDFVQLVAGNSNYELAMTIDGVERLRIKTTEIGSDLNMTAANAATTPLFTSTANKVITLHPFVGLDFLTDFTIAVKATTTPVPTVKWFVKWRELI